MATLVGTSLLLLAAGVAVSLFGGGYAELRAGGDDTRRRLTSALLTAGSLAAAFAVGLQLSYALDDPASSVPVAVGSVTMLVLASCGYAYACSALGLLSIAAAALNAIMNVWSQVDQHGERSWIPALALLGFAAVWLVLTETGRFREPAVARLTGMAIALFGAQIARSDGHLANLAYALLLVVALAGFAMYLRTAAWPYLVGGVVGVTIVVPEAIIDWTGGALGPAGAVLLAGLALLGASLAGFRMHKEVAEDPGEPVHHPAETPPSVQTGS